jgi:hypothetical protein
MIVMMIMILQMFWAARREREVDMLQGVHLSNIRPKQIAQPWGSDLSTVAP